MYYQAIDSKFVDPNALICTSDQLTSSHMLGDGFTVMTGGVRTLDHLPGSYGLWAVTSSSTVDANMEVGYVNAWDPNTIWWTSTTPCKIGNSEQSATTPAGSRIDGLWHGTIGWLHQTDYLHAEFFALEEPSADWSQQKLTISVNVSAMRWFCCFGNRWF